VADAPHLWRKAPFVILLACLFAFGCFPRLLTDKIKPDAENVVNMANSAPDQPPAIAQSVERGASERQSVEPSLHASRSHAPTLPRSP